MVENNVTVTSNNNVTEPGDNNVTEPDDNIDDTIAKLLIENGLEDKLKNNTLTDDEIEEKFSDDNIRKNVKTVRDDINDYRSKKRYRYWSLDEGSKYPYTYSLLRWKGNNPIPIKAKYRKYVINISFEEMRKQQIHRTATAGVLFFFILIAVIVGCYDYSKKDWVWKSDLSFYLLIIFSLFFPAIRQFNFIPKIAMILLTSILSTISTIICLYCAPH